MWRHANNGTNAGGALESKAPVYDKLARSMLDLGLVIRGTIDRLRQDAAEVSERRGRIGIAGTIEIAAREAMHWPAVQRAVANAYHRLYYYNRERTWQNTRWLGHEIQKLPLDLWIYQEIINDVRPRLIVETGTWRGGTTLYLANVLDALGCDGRVVSIDIQAVDQPAHPRITYLDGSSTDASIVDQVRAMVPVGAPVLVILDSDHHTPHVRAEILTYGDLVTPGSYLIVEDTNTAGNPVHHRTIGDGGPMGAVRETLATSDRFEVDPDRERFWVSQNPSGYLRRVR